MLKRDLIFADTNKMLFRSFPSHELTRDVFCCDQLGELGSYVTVIIFLSFNIMSVYMTGRTHYQRNYLAPTYLYCTAASISHIIVNVHCVVSKHSFESASPSPASSSVLRTHSAVTT